MLNEEVFAKGMAMLLKVFDAEKDEEMFSVYYAVLKELTDEQFMNAVAVIIKERNYPSFPKPAEFFEVVKREIDYKAQQALNRIKDAIKQYGRYYSIVDEDPITHAVVDALGGWIRLCEIPDDDDPEGRWKNEWKFLEKDFIRLYKMYAMQGIDVTRVPKKLYGLHDLFNESRSYIQEGIAKEHVAYLGDSQKAIAWQQEAQKQIEYAKALLP